jgi:uncharacterized protein (TIGR03435 family)
VYIALLALLGFATANLPAQPSGATSFEAISIRPSKPDAQGHFRMQNGRLTGDGLLWNYILSAWNLMPSREQIDAMIAHLPKWVATDSFEINAVAEGNPSPEQMRLMLQSLLADRFGLKVHFEATETPVLALVPNKPGKTGPKLRPHSEGLACDSAGKGVNVFPPVCNQFLVTPKPDHAVLVGARNVTLGQIADFVSSLARLDRPVVDQTGLIKPFDFTLEFTHLPKGSPPPDPNASLASSGTTLQEALDEQLGLKLTATTAPRNTLVIDHVERPSQN